MEISKARKKDPTSIPPKKVLAGHSQWLDYNRVSHKNKGEDYKLTTKTVKTPPKSDSEVDALKQKCKRLTKCEDIDGSKTALGGCGFCHNTKNNNSFRGYLYSYFLLGKWDSSSNLWAIGLEHNNKRLFKKREQGICNEVKVVVI